MKLLITGAAGSVGNVLRTGLETDHEIIGVGRTADSETKIAYGIDFSEQPAEMQSILETERPDAVIHLASVVGPACEAEPELAERVNVSATKWLADLAIQKGIKRFIFFSTAAVYQQTELAPTDEMNNIAPQSVYGKTKLAAESGISSLAGTNPGTQFISLRPFNIYGPGFSNSLIYRLIHSSPDDPVHLFAYNNFYRDYVHASDIVQAVRLALTNDFEDRHTIMNIASGVVTNNAELIDELAAAGINPAYTRSDTDEQTVSWADISRAKSIGFTPATSIVIDQ
jgi:UDP-glucose 4-epimerase